MCLSSILRQENMFFRISISNYLIKSFEGMLYIFPLSVGLSLRLAIILSRNKLTKKKCTLTSAPLTSFYWKFQCHLIFRMEYPTEQQLLFGWKISANEVKSENQFYLILFSSNIMPHNLCLSCSSHICTKPTKLNIKQFASSALESH